LSQVLLKCTVTGYLLLLLEDIYRNDKVLLRVKEQKKILHDIRKRKANWIGHISRRNCILQRVTEGKIKGVIQVTERQEKRCRKEGKERILSFERGSSGSHYVESSLWKRLWTCHKTDY
jgi:hypothetical protein